MSFIKTFFCLFLFLSSFLSAAQSMDLEDKKSKYLSRYFTEYDENDILDKSKQTTVESCRYYPASSKISFNVDEVYCQEYNLLNEEIKNHIQFLSNNTPRYGKVNFLTVILSATGKKNGKIEREWRNLYVREENKVPTLQTLKSEEQDKILVFCSEQFPDFSYYKNPKRCHTFSNIERKTSLEVFNKFHKFSHEFNKENNTCKNKYDLFRSSSFPATSPVRKKFDEKYKDKYNNESHTEPICFSAIQTLSEDTFKKLLPDDYELSYYEIHLISYLDACSGCTKIVYQEMDNIKQKFGPDLFMFFHSAKSVIEKCINPYTIKYQMKFIRCSFNFDDFGLKMRQDPESQKEQDVLAGKTIDVRKDINLDSIPLYYFGIMHEIEGHDVTITK